MKKMILVLCVLFSAGCQPSTDVAIESTESTAGGQPVKLVSQVVEAACGECKLGMEGNGCDLAVRIDGKDYFVDGSSMSDHGNAHGEDGMCNTVRKAKVTGEVQGDRFVATSFELLPLDGEAENQDEAPHDESVPHTH